MPISSLISFAAGVLMACCEVSFGGLFSGVSREGRVVACVGATWRVGVVSMSWHVVGEAIARGGGGFFILDSNALGMSLEDTIALENELLVALWGGIWETY